MHECLLKGNDTLNVKTRLRKFYFYLMQVEKEQRNVNHSKLKGALKYTNYSLTCYYIVSQFYVSQNAYAV